MCGITGFYPKKKQKADFNILKGIAAINDERGKDNSGISIGDIFYERCDTNKYIRDLISKFKTDISELNLADQPWIMHTRSSSIKSKQKAVHAHPFNWEYTNDAGEKVDYFYGCHNGFISNTIELHKKYLLDTGARTNTSYQYEVDSEVILDAIVCNIHKEEAIHNILRDYTGNAALIFYREREFWAWKGANNNVEERPLYYVETRAGWYFSSIESSLSMYFDGVKEVPNNTLLVFKDGKFVKDVLIPRAFTPKVSTHSTYYGANMNTSHLAPEGTKPAAKISTPVWTFLKDNGLWSSYSDSTRGAKGEPLQGLFWVDDPINETCVYTGHTSRADSTIHFFNGVAMMKDSVPAQVAITLMQTAQTMEAALGAIELCKEEIKAFIIGFVPFYVKNVLAGFVVDLNGELLVVPEGKKYRITILGKEVRVSLKPNPKIEAAPIKTIA